MVTLFKNTNKILCIAFIVLLVSICVVYLNAQKYKEPRKLLLKDSTTIIRVAEVLWESELGIKPGTYRPYTIKYRDSLAFVSGFNDSIYLDDIDGDLTFYTSPHICINRYTCEVYVIRMKH